MDPAGIENQNHEDQAFQLSLDQRLFIALEKEKGKNTTEIKTQFSLKWPGKDPPHRSTIYKIWKKLRNNHTVQNLNKGNSGRRMSGRSDHNIDQVRALLEDQVDKKPDEIVCSSRRNNLDLTKSTFNRITRLDIKFHPYKILRRQKISPRNVNFRLSMGRFLSGKSKEWFKHISVSDEARFSLGGHVFNMKNTVLYSPKGQGTPEQWFSESSQA